MSLKEDIEKLIKEGEEALREAREGVKYLEAVGELVGKEKQDIEEAEKRLKKYQEALKVLT